jgi:UDP-glucose 4-epimerase
MSIYGDPEYLPVDESHPLRPKTFYAAAKISAEAYIKFYQTLGIDTTIFRLFSVYGPGQNLENRMQGMLSIYLSYMLSGEPVIIKGSGKRFRDFVYIDDVVDAWVSSLFNPAAYGKVYNVASGKRTTVEGLIKLLKAGFDSKDHPVEYKSGTPGDQFGVVGDVSRIRKELKWRPRTDIGAGISRMIKFETERTGRVQKI